LTEVPTLTVLVLSEIDLVVDAVTVNDAEAELDDASVALTVCVPAAEDDGTVMEAVKLPVEVVVIVVGVVVIAALSYDIVMPEFGAKLLPEMFTVVPVGPLDGLSDIVAAGAGGTVTVNDAEAE